MILALELSRLLFWPIYVLLHLVLTRHKRITIRVCHSLSTLYYRDRSCFPYSILEIHNPDWYRVSC